MGVGSLICLLSAPPTFLNPWDRPALPFVDTVGEQMGLVGLALISLALWHLYFVAAQRNVDQREAYLLRQSPNLYTHSKQGWFSDDCIFVQEGDVNSWVSWSGVGHFQQGQELLLIDWGPGIGGTSVMTADMFDSTVDYRNAGRLLAAKSPAGFQWHRLGDLPEHFLFPEHTKVRPEAETVIATCDHTTTYRDAWNRVSAKIPTEIFQSSRPLHYFFVYVAVLAIVFVQRWWISLFLLGCFWLFIFGAGVVLAWIQVNRLLRRANQRLLTTRTQFTSDTVHVHSTVAYSMIPIDGFTLVKQHDDRLVIQHKDAATTSELLRSDFVSDADWTSACDLFGKRQSIAD